MWDELWQVLKQHQQVWQYSLLQGYPQSLEPYPDSWLLELKNLDENSLFHFDESGALDELPHLQSVLGPLQACVRQVPQNHRPVAIIAPHKSGLSEKKCHEIEALLGLAGQQVLHHQCPVIDWGGGIGHLAANLGRHTGRQVFSVDRNQDLQAKGRKRYGNQVDFISADLQSQGDFPQELINLLHRPHGSIALHACGALSLTQLAHAQNFACEWLINLGCCYHFLSPEQTMISQAAGNYGFKLSPSALDLATRTRSKKNLDHFHLKRRVNSFRWAIQLFLAEELGSSEFREVGRCADRIYRSDFADYAALVAERLQLTNQQLGQLRKFYLKDDVQQRLQTIFLIHLIRWQFARPLELALVADRSQLLCETGFQSQVMQLFDERLSPRNLGIIAFH